MSSPARRRLAPRLTPAGSPRRRPRAATSSCISTVSAPAGIGAPVSTRSAVPCGQAPRERMAGGGPPGSQRAGGSARSGARSAWAKAKPSTATLSKPGTSRSLDHRLGQDAAVRLRRAARSRGPTTGRTRCSSSASASPAGRRLGSCAKQSSSGPVPSTSVLAPIGRAACTVRCGVSANVAHSAGRMASCARADRLTARGASHGRDPARYARAEMPAAGAARAQGDAGAGPGAAAPGARDRPRHGRTSGRSARRPATSWWRARAGRRVSASGSASAAEQGFTRPVRPARRLGRGLAARRAPRSRFSASTPIENAIAKYR